MRLSSVVCTHVLAFCLSAGLIAANPVSPVWGEEASPLPKSAELPSSNPSLADVVYQAGALAQRLEGLKNRPDTAANLQRLEQQLKQAGEEVDRFLNRLGVLQDDDLQSYQQLAVLKGEAHSENETVKRAVASLTEIIREIESRRRNWLTEKKRWEQWRSQMGEDMTIASVSDAFARATASIDAALDILSKKMEPMLGVQQQAGDIGAKFSRLNDQIDNRMAKQRGGTLKGGMPPMFSIAYLQQLIELIHEPARFFRVLPPPDPTFFTEKGWVLFLQVLVFVVFFALVRRYRAYLLEHPDRRFLGKRPIALSLFVAVFTLSFLYGAQPTLWRFLIQTVAGVATARLVAAFVGEPWVKRAINILVLVMIAFQVLLIVGVPPAPMRLFLLLWSVAGVVYFGWRARRRRAAGSPAWQVWSLHLIVLVFAVIAVADVMGFGNFAVQIMDGAIRTSILLLMGWAMLRLVRVVLEMGKENLPMQRIALLHRNADAILRKAILFANLVIVVFVAGNLLVAWKIYAIPAEALQSFFSFGMTIGEQRVTIGLVVTAALILYGAFVISWSLQALLMDNVLNRGQMDAGARLSIVRLVHYAMILIGFLIALSSLGFELKNVTIIGGALGVGIGFGMQAIVNNFVSGLILLFERPIKVGDVIVLNDGQQGRVTHLGLRATTVQTFDRAEIVVPNGDLISSQVTNWTLGDRTMRLIIPVGVAYGSDVETVMRVLMAVAADSDQVLKEPQPMVLFLNFGDSSLDFQLRVWIADFNDRRIVQSALIREIDRRFREEGVEIPFPQRDLHLRSVDGKAADRLHGGRPSTSEGHEPEAIPVNESD